MDTLKCPNCVKNQNVKILGVKPLMKAGGFEVWFCRDCLNGFTYPVPKDISKYYPETYWNNTSTLGRMRNFIYTFFQKRRIKWVKKYLTAGKILDVGAGEGAFGELQISNYKFQITSIDSPWAKLENQSVLKVDFLNWSTKQKFDAITFWESLEHTPEPQKYLKKANTILKGNGLVFIEYPRFNALESRIFDKYWYHLDLPRHLSHLTNKGLPKLLERTGFKVIFSKDIFALEYVLAGFIISMFSLFRKNIKNSVSEGNVDIILALAMPLIIPPALLFEIALSLLGQSPVGLIVARKVKNAGKA